MPIRLTPQSLTVENKLWTAEVTPPEGGGHPWWSPGPMTVGDLIAALRAAGCSQADIDKALREANADYAQAFRDADAEKKYGPAVNAALSGDYEPPSGTPFTEPMVAYVLFFDKKPESLAELLHAGRRGSEPSARQGLRQRALRASGEADEAAGAFGHLFRQDVPLSFLGAQFHARDQAAKIPVSRA